MKPEEWQRVKELCGAALQRPPGERSQFLATACSDDDVRREVETLLAAYESRFLEGRSSAMAEMIVNRPGNELPMSVRRQIIRLRSVLVGLFAVTSVGVYANSYFNSPPHVLQPDDYGFGVSSRSGI
jgi:hypothetical protein